MPPQKPKDIYIQEELERRILHGLACEWDGALWTLKTSHRNKMNKPLFSLRDMNGKWGYWSGENYFTTAAGRNFSVGVDSNF